MGIRSLTTSLGFREVEHSLLDGNDMEYLIVVLIVVMALVVGLAIGNWLRRFRK